MFGVCPFCGQLSVTQCYARMLHGTLHGMSNVAVGSLTDIPTSPRHVRFTPESGHSVTLNGCLLIAKSGHLAQRSLEGAASVALCGAERLIIHRNLSASLDVNNLAPAEFK